MERKEAIEIVKSNLPDSIFTVTALREALETLIPELAESEDELMRKEAISIIKQYNIICEREGDKCYTADRVITWLENQDRQMIAKGERKSIALSLINYLDNNRVEGCMDLSSMECEDIEDACINSKWIKLYNYMKKKLEKQDNTDKASYDDAEKENDITEETNAPTEYGKYIDECLNEAAKHFFSEGEDKYSVADLFYAGVRCGESWLEKQDKQTNKINSYEFTFEDVLASECAMKTAKITKDGEELYKMLVPLYNKIHKYYLLEKQDTPKD